MGYTKTYLVPGIYLPILRTIFGPIIYSPPVIACYVTPDLSYDYCCTINIDRREREEEGRIY